MKTLQGTWLTLLAISGWLYFTPFAGGTAYAQRVNDGETAEADNSKMAAEAEPEDKPKDSESAASTEDSSSQRSTTGINRGPVIMFGQNVELKAGETAEVVVVIGGSATVHGRVKESVVAIGGDVEVDGEVGEEVVAVMGSVHVRQGAVIKGDVVSVGGKLEADEGAKIRGQTEEVAIGGIKMRHADWIQKWLSSCVFLLRPLSPSVGWIWGVALVYFLLFLFIAAVFRTPVQACVNELTSRPATTFLTGLLTKMLLPLIILILFVLVVGIVVVPFLVAAIFVLSLVGKVAVLEAMGFSVGRLLGKREVSTPILALVIGSTILALLYMIPVVGLLTMLLLSVWSLGCATTAAFRGFRREVPEKRSTPVVPAYSPAMAGAAAGPGYTQQSQSGGLPGDASSGVAGSAATASASVAATATLPGEPPVMPEVLVYPKATFWERIAAGFLDLILVLILGSLVRSVPFTLVIGLAYVTALWTWKGTTIGGIVLGLKVARMDGQPVTFAVALVRGLAAGFSAIVLFLGFIWIVWDADKQAWHDKIAGTVVLRLPRGTPLICL